MRRFSPEEAVAAVELQHLFSEYWYDIEANMARNVGDFWVEDGIFTSGMQVNIKGRAAIKKFYEEINERILKEERGGVRTARHTWTNMRTTFHGKDRASLDMTVVTYSAGGPPPIMGTTSPSIVSDARIEVRRDANGEWHMFEFHANPLFIGVDPFLNKTVMGEPAKA